MRLALVSDIHGNLAALEAVRADIRRRGADAVLNLGDSLSGPLLPRVMRSATGAWVVNPGSMGRPAYDDIHPLYHRVEMGSPDARYAIVERQGAAWRCPTTTRPWPSWHASVVGWRGRTPCKAASCRVPEPARPLRPSRSLQPSAATIWSASTFRWAGSAMCVACGLRRSAIEPGIT